MARNEEKANSLLNKWVTMKQEFSKTGGDAPKRRPYLSSECDDLTEAERWRLDVVRETSRSIGEIQNAGLGEHRVRDLNDQINKLLREKYHWQKRIKELGGGDYNAKEPKSFDADGRELPGGGGYKYFGAAKELPGVRELFQAEAPQASRRTRGDMYKNITPDYYGYRDEDDGTLLMKEGVAEKRDVANAVDEFERVKQRRKLNPGAAAIEADEDEDESEEEEEEEDAAQDAGAAASQALRAHVPVPSQDVIQTAILDHRKKKLEEMFLS